MELQNGIVEPLAYAKIMFNYMCVKNFVNLYNNLFLSYYINGENSCF